MYGGGGSPSSRSLLERPSLVSGGSAALVSATTELSLAGRSSSSNGGAGADGLSGGARAGSGLEGSQPVTSALYGSAGEGAGK